MGYQWGLGLHFVFATILLVATKNTCLSARNLNSTVACFEHERLALLKFKHSVTDDYGMLSSWVGNDCCRWERVMCDGVTGHVVSLHLRGDDDASHGRLVSEELGTSLGELRHLKYMDLSGNDFEESRIPEFIGSLKQLTYLNLSGAWFSGIIPHQIGNLSNLKYLDLNSFPLGNGLMAHDTTWISGLSLLEHLDLSFANLSGARNLDMVRYMIPSLKVLRLSLCRLSNGNLAPLRNLSISYSNIKHLDLSANYFNGPLPHFFQNMTSLHFLDLSRNNIDFGLTFNFANFLSMFPSLSELGLSYCNQKETRLSHILHNFTTLSNIRRLDLSSNTLTGSIPESLRKLKSLQVLDLSSNKLTCPIPTFLGKLTELYLHSNYLTGSIPESMSKLNSLQVLDLSGNNFTGLIPESMSKLNSLQVLDLSGNNFTGPIPIFHWKLTELYLSGNDLNGSIPESIGSVAALTALSLYDNKLSGTIPVSIGQLSKLRSLDVSHNDLEGVVFEAHFANLSMLEYLNAASNAKLVFNVSREWQPPFKNLINVNLNSCKIINGFPQWL
ncbi:putative non-specific serine/threonine protein kinase [Helianthus debilis subsp. tardiflorus]